MLRKEFAFVARCNPQGYPQKLWIDVIGMQSDCHVDRKRECTRVINEGLAFVSAVPFPGGSLITNPSIGKARYIPVEYAEHAPQGDLSSQDCR